MKLNYIFILALSLNCGPEAKILDTGVYSLDPPRHYDVVGTLVHLNTDVGLRVENEKTYQLTIFSDSLQLFLFTKEGALAEVFGEQITSPGLRGDILVDSARILWEPLY